MMKRSRTGFLLLSALLLGGLILARDEGKVTPLLVKGQAYTAPFQAGERLRYEVNWKPVFMLPAFKAGEISFEIGESQYQGRPAFNISMDAISAGRLIEVANLEVRNRFESIIDRKSFQSYRILKKTRQSKRKRDTLTVFDYLKNSTWLRELDASTDPPKQLRNRTIPGIPGPLTDVVSVFYAIRVHRLESGREYTLNLSDNGRAREMRVQVQEREKVETGLASSMRSSLRPREESSPGGAAYGSGTRRIDFGCPSSSRPTSNSGQSSVNWSNSRPDRWEGV